MNVDASGPDDARVAFEEGVAHHRAGRVTQALAAYAQALAFDPKMSAALVNRAVGLNQLGQREEAMECLNQALSLDPTQPVSWMALSDVLKALGHADEAATALRRALTSRPGFAPAVASLADALIDSGDVAEAEMMLDGLLAQNPGDWIAWQRLGQMHIENRRTNAAIACLQRALAIKPDRDDVRMTLAQAFVKVGALAVADKVYRDILARHPDYGPALIGLAQTLVGQGQLDEAEPLLEHALAGDPQSVDGHLARARLNFLAGRLAKAWPDYAWRKNHPSFTAPDIGRPAWDGSPLGGRRILLIAEQGIGDTLQFLRYVPMVARTGGRVFLAVPAALKKLVSSVYGVTSVVGEGEPIPSVDVQAHLLDLPALFGTTEAEVPAPIPYLSVTGPTVKLDPPAGTRLKVGLVWAGNPDHPEDERRSCPFTLLQELLGVEGVAYYSLQTGPNAVDLVHHAHPALIADLAPSLTSFADTAAFLAQLDLLITVDTAVVHLAGALGVPTFVMLAFAPDWRWRQTGEDTPWYPSLKLFRQRRPGDWSEVIRGVALGLREKLGLPPPGTVALQPSVFRKADGQPRYLMPIPQKLAEDVGVRFLVSREREFGGFEYPFRRFLDVHLEADDLFIDAGAHWGIMSLHAATHHTGKVTVLAIEPAAVNLGPLRRWIEVNNVTQAVEIVAAGLSDQAGRGRLMPESTMGLSIAPADATDYRSDTVPLTTIDALLADRPHLAEKRTIVKIDVEGLEPEVIEGMKDLLDSGRVAAMIIERGRSFDAPEGADRFKAMLAALRDRGYGLYRFAHEGLGGPLVPYVFCEDLCNVVALAAGTAKLAAYPRAAGPIPPSTQPERSRLEPAAKARRTKALIEAKSSDVGFWSDWANLEDGALERAQAAARYLAAGDKVLDLGCGQMRLREALGPEAAYSSADLVPWAPETLAVDLNQGQFPEGRFDCVALLEVLEFLHDPLWVLEQARRAAPSLLLTYRLRQGEMEMARRTRGWVNDWDYPAFREALDKTGWRMKIRLAVAETTLFVCRAVK